MEGMRRLERLRGAVLAVLLLAGGREASALGPITAPAPWPNSPASHPRLEAPPVPQPGQISVPHAAVSQLLWADKEIQVTAPVRLMVFAPHPDDETLAAGGLIQRVLARNGQVRVVFITNGDGYVDGVRKEVRRQQTSTADFIEYGERRHREALHAIQALGLPVRNALFLGFPDDGIDDLWSDNWSARKPYRSPYTRFDRPVYKESLSRHVEYTGIDLEGEISKLLQDFSPDWVLVPDPRDRHPDHCTTGVFVLDALRKLRQASEHHPLHPKVMTFLVHYPDYPASPTWIKEVAGAGVGGSSAAGRELSAAGWAHLQLTSSESVAKGAALSKYESQIQVMHPFLKQFLLPFELFGQLDGDQIRAVPREYAARFRRR